MKMRSKQQKLHWQHQKVEKQAKTCQNQQNAKNSGEPAQHEPHSITSQRTDAVFIYIYIDRYSSLWPCGAHSARSGQGQPSEMRVPGCAACSGVRIFILWQCFVRLRSRHAGCWWMVSVDGALHGVVWYSCWQVYGTETESPLERMLYFTYLWLATSWFVSGGCACYLSFRFLSLGGSGNLKQEGAEGAERLHPYRQTNKECHWRWKQPANTCLQASLHKHKTAGSNERQQENEDSGQKYRRIS